MSCLDMRNVTFLNFGCDCLIFCKTGCPLLVIIDIFTRVGSEMAVEADVVELKCNTRIAISAFL